MTYLTLDVDMTAAWAQGDIITPAGRRYDRRCVLYTNTVTSKHRYVWVKTSSGIMAPTELKSTDDNMATLSLGLATTLHLTNKSTEIKNSKAQLTVIVEDRENSTCLCDVGEVVSVQIQFRSRDRPSRTIYEGLKQSIGKILLNEHVWSGMCVQVNWLNEFELVDFLNVQLSNGTGCCQHIGKITCGTRVGLSFAGALTPPMRCTPRNVDEYVANIAQTLGGVESYTNTILSALLARLFPDSNSQHVPPSIGAVLTGLPGVGKTALVKAVVDQVGVPVRYLNAVDVFQTYVGHTESLILNIFEEIAQQAPSLLVIDGLESIASIRRTFVDSENPLEVNVLGTFIACLDKLKLASTRVFVLSTTSRIEAVDSGVITNGRIDVIIPLEPPSRSARLEILRIMLKDWALGDPIILEKLSDATGGFVGADLQSLCQKTLHIYLNESKSKLRRPLILFHHFEQALGTTFPSVLHAHHMSLHQYDGIKATNATENALSGIYGVDEALRTIKVSLIEPLEDCSRFLAFGTIPPKGILLTGPPGCGKTYLANCIAKELRQRGLASFVSVRCTDLLTKVVGDTEQSLRELFVTARSAAPCVIYFDQIESIAPVRGFDTSTEQTFDRLLSMLLVEMDGFSRNSLKIATGDQARSTFLREHVVILASTTDKTLLDPAILRPGRFDIHIRMKLPDKDARHRLVLDALRQIPLDYSSCPEYSSAESVAMYVADHTEGYTAGDISSLFREAAMASMRNDFEANTISFHQVMNALKS